MLELKNVSKFYYSKNTVASGFSKVNLKLEEKEFIAITGESGSGKSTLLNVISGLDTYEEGEMYINGEETSGYTEVDFENYRKKYIGNIFQNFNLVNSYTVYQNVELVLLINGYKKREIKRKILDTLEKVDLLKYKNTKVSKLSGGQKQRVAIARALVKDTPIIVADEPTGNLDSETAANIVELLRAVSEDKLVIVVTHNYEQIEKYVTRKITMHDGKIIEDKKIKEITEKNNKESVETSGEKESTETLESKELEEKTDNKEEAQASNQTPEKDLVTKPIQNKKKSLSNLNKLKLGIRNTFNIKIKFILLLMVFVFLSTAVVAEYSAFKKQGYEESNMGYNNFFRDTSDKRIVIKKNDLTEIKPEEYEKIKQLANVDYIVENDLLLDQEIFMNMDNFSIYSKASDISLLKNELTYGEMPKSDNEVVLKSYENFYIFSQNPEQLLGKEFYIQDNYRSNVTSEKVKVVGIAIDNGDDKYETKVYVNPKILDEIRKNINISSSNITTEFNNKIFNSYPYAMQYKVVPNPNVPVGKAYVSQDLNYMTKRNNCINYTMNITADNLYYKENLSVKIAKTYNKNNITKLLGLKNFDENNGAIYVNPEQYYNLFNKGNYQSSVFIKDVKELETTLAELENLGYHTLYVKDTLINYMDGESGVIAKAVKIIIIGIVTTALFFISYFVIKIILKSRNVYFSTIRILGATRKNAKQLLNIELFTILNLSYALLLGAIALIKQKIIEFEFLQELMTYLEIKDLVILYAILFVISLLISRRYSKQLFKKSAMNTYREEEV